MTTSIDFKTVVALANLEAIITADLGTPVIRQGKPHWHCPWHPDENPSLHLLAGGRRWRCWPCRLMGDVVDFVARRDGITPVEAARQLDPLAGQNDGAKKGERRANTNHHDATARSQEPKPTRALPWQDSAWQVEADQTIAEAEEILWSPRGQRALDWLHDRGLDDSTIRRFRLGFVPRDFNTRPIKALGLNDRGRPRGIWVERGITIPWAHPEAWYEARGKPDVPRWVGCQVRRLAADFGDPKPKYRAFVASERGHAYPSADVTPGLPAFVCEGEFDALLARQEFGHAVNVLTVGGTGQEPRPDAMSALNLCPAWLLAFDHDKNRAGDNAARAFAALAPGKCVRARLPFGKDLTEFVQQGGLALEWLACEFARLGWAWPSVAVANDPTAWRWQAANLPWDRWLTWRQRATEILAGFGGEITADGVRRAERTAYEEVREARRQADAHADRRTVARSTSPESETTP